MSLSKRQGQLFSEQILEECSNTTTQEIELSINLLRNWQQRIISHQANLYQDNYFDTQQVSLFNNSKHCQTDLLQPLSLTPLSLSFWRWPSSPHNGPAIYLVMDLPENSDTHLMLYIGETNSAEKRWKGEHDCKAYLASYCEALGIVNLKSNLSIRFWTDVPEETRPRRQLEQLLIQKWQPPFNKETRSRWATPFTTEIC